MSSLGKTPEGRFCARTRLAAPVISYVIVSIALPLQTVMLFELNPDVRFIWGDSGTLIT